MAHNPHYPFAYPPPSPLPPSPVFQPGPGQHPGAPHPGQTFPPPQQHVAGFYPPLAYSAPPGHHQYPVPQPFVSPPGAPAPGFPPYHYPAFPSTPPPQHHHGHGGTHGKPVTKLTASAKVASHVLQGTAAVIGVAGALGGVDGLGDAVSASLSSLHGLGQDVAGEVTNFV